MLTADQIKTAIKPLRAHLSKNELFGFTARAHLLYLSFLRGVPHETIEVRVDQETYYANHPLAEHVRATLGRQYPAAFPAEEFPVEDFRLWCAGLKDRVKPVTPYVKKERKSTGAKTHDAA